MTPERLKEIRAVLDRGIYITDFSTDPAYIDAANELYDAVSAMMPVMNRVKITIDHHKGEPYGVSFPTVLYRLEEAYNLATGGPQ